MEGEEEEEGAEEEDGDEESGVELLRGVGASLFVSFLSSSSSVSGMQNKSTKFFQN